MVNKLQKSRSASHAPASARSSEPGNRGEARGRHTLEAAVRRVGIAGLDVRTAARAAVSKINGKLAKLRSAVPAGPRTAPTRPAVAEPASDGRHSPVRVRPAADPQARKVFRLDGVPHVQIGSGVPRPLVDEPSEQSPQRASSAGAGRPRPLPPTPSSPAALRLDAFAQSLSPPDALAWKLAWNDLRWLAGGPFDADRLRDDRADAVARRNAHALAGQAELLQELLHTMHRSRRVLFHRFRNQPNFGDVQGDIEHQVDDAMAAFAIQLGPELDALAAARRQLAPPAAPDVPPRPGNLYREPAASTPLPTASSVESGTSSFRWDASARAGSSDDAGPAELEANPPGRH